MSSLTDAIKERITIIDYMEKQGIPYSQKGKYYQTNEMDSLMVKPDKKHFTRYSNDTFGSVIDFAMEYNNITKDEAIKELRGMLGGKEQEHFLKRDNISGEKMVRDNTKAAFTLPKKFDGKFSRLYAFLNKTRGISPKVITDMINRKMLYEDNQYHNAVWVGYDYDGKARFGCKRVAISSDVMQNFVVKNNKNPTQARASGVFINDNLGEIVIANVEIKQKMLEDIIKKLEINKINLAFDTKETNVKKKQETVQQLKKLKAKCQVGYVDFEQWRADEERLKCYKTVEEPFLRGDIEGSSKEVGLFINNNSASLLVCE
ncbi:MAG: DUF3991 domain-containing protein, partial [Oscillospiraceae bacterium]